MWFSVFLFFQLWQATRFALLNFDASFTRPASLEALSAQMSASPSLCDSWILHRLHVAVVSADAAFRKYEFATATTAIYNFWLYDLCDVYLELIKPTVRLSENPTDAERAARNASLAVLYTCLDNGLKLLHPFMPFITEELYHRLPGADVKGAGGRNECGSIMTQAYPSPAVTEPLFAKPQLDATMALLQSIAHAARSTRASLNLTKQRLTMYIRCANEELFEAVRDNAKDITVMSNAEKTIAMHRYAHCTAVALMLPSRPMFSPCLGVEAGCDFITPAADCCIFGEHWTLAVFRCAVAPSQQEADAAETRVTLFSVSLFVSERRREARGWNLRHTPRPLYSMTFWSSSYAALSHE